MDTKHPSLGTRGGFPGVSLIWDLISPGETHRAKVSDNSLDWITSPWEFMLFSSAFWKQTFNDTSGITVLFRVTS